MKAAATIIPMHYCQRVALLFLGQIFCTRKMFHVIFASTSLWFVFV